MLKLHFKDNSQPAFWVTDKLYCIGTASDNQLIIKDPSVDSLHAKLIAEDNKFLLKDNNSSSGCFINGQRVTQKEILPGDIIKIGNTEMIVLDPRHLPENANAEEHTIPWRLVSDSSWLPGKTFVIPVGKPVIIGRGEQCDITIPGSHLSRRHAEFCIQGAHLMVRDLGSANGTFLNEKQITEGVAHNGDKIRIDVYTFRLVAPDTDEQKTRVRVPIDALSKPIEKKQASSEPKRWKTRPTSPGNRIEPTYAETRPKAWIWILAIVIVIAVIAGKFLW